MRLEPINTSLPLSPDFNSSSAAFVSSRSKSTSPQQLLGPYSFPSAEARTLTPSPRPDYVQSGYGNVLRSSSPREYRYGAPPSAFMVNSDVPQVTRAMEYSLRSTRESGERAGHEERRVSAPRFIHLIPGYIPTPPVTQALPTQARHDFERGWNERFAQDAKYSAVSNATTTSQYLSSSSASSVNQYQPLQLRSPDKQTQHSPSAYQPQSSPIYATDRHLLPQPQISPPVAKSSLLSDTELCETGSSSDTEKQLGADVRQNPQHHHSNYRLPSLYASFLDYPATNGEDSTAYKFGLHQTGDVERRGSTFDELLEVMGVTSSNGSGLDVNSSPDEMEDEVGLDGSVRSSPSTRLRAHRNRKFVAPKSCRTLYHPTPAMMRAPPELDGILPVDNTTSAEADFSTMPTKKSRGRVPKNGNGTPTPPSLDEDQNDSPVGTKSRGRQRKPYDKKT